MFPCTLLTFCRYQWKPERLWFNKSGEIKVGVNNLFHKAFGIDQTASINCLRRVTTHSSGRYYMVGFTYPLNKQLNPMAMRRRHWDDENPQVRSGEDIKIKANGKNKAEPLRSRSKNTSWHKCITHHLKRSRRHPWFLPDSRPSYHPKGGNEITLLVS